MTLSYIPSDTNAEGILKAAASGTLPNGKPVVVNADGTVSVVAETAQAIGSAEVFESATSASSSSTFDSSSNKVVVAYRDGGNSQHGTAVVGTVSGTSISFGTPVVFNSSGSYEFSTTFDSNSNKVVIAYQDAGNSFYGTAIVGTVSGTAISFGSPVVFNTASSSYNAATFDSSSNKVVIAYSNGTASGNAIVGTISGTAISFGTAVVFNSSRTTGKSSTFDSLNNKVVIAYNDYSNSQRGTAIVGTVSGTGISFGTAVIFEANASHISSAFDSSSNKIVISYNFYNGSASVGTVIVGTVSGTGISFGTSVTFNASSSAYTSATFDSNASRVVIAYYNSGNSNYGTVIVGTVSGTGISFGDAVVFESAASTYISSTFDSNSNKVVIAYTDGGNSSYGTSIVFQPGFTNLTAENYIGMSSGVVDVTGTAGGTGSETVFEQATSRHVASAYDTNTNRVVIAYADNGNSQYGTAIVGTVSGTSISFGSPVVFETAEVQNVSVVFDSNSNKIVIAYADEGNSSHGTAIVGTVSGTAISFGSAVVFEAANSGSIVATFDSNSNKAVIAYQDLGNSNYGTAIVGTVSGTGISFGTAVVFEQAEVSGNSIKVAFDSSSNKIVIVYRDSGNSSYGTAIVGTVSGTGISFGTAVVFNAAATNSNGVPIIDTDNNKVIVSYKDSGNSNYGTARVGTVSGTSISFGTAVVFNSGNTELYAGQAYHPNIQRAVIGYRDDGDSNIGKYNVGTVSGTDISFAGEVVFNSGRADNLSLIYDPDSENLVMSFEDNANSSYGTSLVFTPSTLAINRGEVPSGSQAITNIIGSVSSIQTGLTAGQSYFVQTDGTIGLTADDPSVFAGTAISATKLIVKT